MNLIEAMAQYGLSDKERFECSFPEWQKERESSTFFADFSVADCYGEAAVRDTYRRAFGGWKSNYKMLTELVVALNHKIWQHHGEKNEAYARLYDELWREADAWAVGNLKGEEAAFFYRVTD